MYEEDFRTIPFISLGAKAGYQITERASLPSRQFR
ncbi:hypothetical protein MESS4_60096 [Mesorhizobium sp. STM 4661]|nr:hypothetical protein MESS4_60096 [Mesorhizobium sp. STM 4661]